MFFAATHLFFSCGVAFLSWGKMKTMHANTESEHASGCNGAFLFHCSGKRVTPVDMDCDQLLSFASQMTADRTQGEKYVGN